MERLRVFGSVARGEEGPDSDIDLIADFSDRIGFFGLMRFERELASLLERPVDLVTEAGLSPYMREGILASARVVYESAG